jgi:hypothetical protein
MSRLRRHLLWSGLAGLVAGSVLAALGTWLVTSRVVRVLLPYPALVLLFTLIFGGFSLAEVPMMVFAMRRLLVEPRGNYRFVLGLNALFVFFAAVYGTPVLLLTGSLSWGLALCGLGIVRLAASLLFVRQPSRADP